MSTAAVHCLAVALLLVGVSPGFAAYHRYWGDVHVHTNLSDGKGSLDDVLTYARDVAHLDFVIVTDHDFGNGGPWRMPKADWERVQQKVEEYTVPGKFVAIAGYEWTSQPKYWSEVGPGEPSERLFPGPPRFYNHKNVYFPAPVPYLFNAKDQATQTPDLLAQAVRAAGGLIQNNHPTTGPDGHDQFDYARSCDAVIANTEMLPDVMFYQGKRYVIGGERAVCDFLRRGGKTGFVGGTDTHDLKPAARTAVYATALTRPALFEALRHRRNCAVSQARIALDFRVDGRHMGEEITVEGPPTIAVDVTGTDTLREVALVRDGRVLLTETPSASHVRFTHVDGSFRGHACYYVRVTQADADANGNPSRAWSSPIWVSGNGEGVR